MSTQEPTLNFERLVADYVNAAAHNDQLHAAFTAATAAQPRLRAHRNQIEKEQLGFGDAAFHAMWLSLLQAAARRFGAVRALEIGVYKGQVISLWALIARHWQIDLQISAVSPLAGGRRPNRLVEWLRYRLDPAFREAVDNGNFYDEADYEAIVRALFARYELSFDTVRLFRGFSTDPKLLADLAGEMFHVIYVDGDHTRAGSEHDFRTFGPKVVPGGWLIADDAGCDVPGTTFWKGHRAVSDAVRILAELGFTNVLNVGHNRIYQRKAG